MRVLYLTKNHALRSYNRSTDGWFRHLVPKGLSPVLISDKPGSFPQWTTKQNLPAYVIKLPFPSKLMPLPFVNSLWNLAKIVRRHKIELIHCTEQDSFPIGKYLSIICKLPVVVSVQFTMERSWCEWLFKDFRLLKRLFFASRGNMDNCRDALTGIVPEPLWRTLHNGIDTLTFRSDLTQGTGFRKRHGLESGLLIGNACALRPVKQLEHLFEASRRLCQNDLKVVVAGFSMPRHKQYSLRILEEGKEKLGDRFLYLGELETDQLVGFYNALDIFVNTSKEEAFGVSNLEAMSCGCPTLGYSSKSTVSEVVLPDGGEIVEQDDTDKLSEALNRWLNDREGLSLARIRARKQAEQFEISKIANLLWEEYQDILYG